MQSAITHLICLTVLVLAAIDLHYQPHFQAHEIEHVPQERMLAAELEARHLPTAQIFPQAIFSIGHVGSQLFLKRVVENRTIRLPLHTPIPLSIPAPLPHPHPVPPLEGEGVRPPNLR